MRLLTCTGCKFAGDCDHARHMRASLKLMGIRSVKFACAKREDLYAPGQAVVFQTWVTTDDEYRPSVEVYYPGYALGHKGTRVFGFIAPGTPDTSGHHPFEPRAAGYVKIPLSRVRPDPTRENGDARQCGWCARHPGLGAGCGVDLNYTPRGKCLAGKERHTAQGG
jgi:hypothetical protein